MSSSATAIVKKDHNKQQWEESEFPLVCETCLGDNPYMRMTREKHGKQCQICETPFTVFSWTAGTKGRLKRVEICQNCARTKNVCQVCIFDLQYGLPVQLRDSILKEHADTSGSSSAGSVVPKSDANRAWFKQAQQRAIEQGTAGVMSGSMEATLKLREAAKMAPQYDRNLAKLCTFFARGECNRGSRCPFRHEMPRDRNDPLAKQSTKSRFYGINDPLAAKMMNGIKAKEEEMMEGVDKNTTTLYVGFDQNEDNNVDLNEMDLRDAFYSFGEIVSVRMKKDGDGAFVEYSAREATSLAIAAMNRKSIRGVQLYVNWAKSSKRGGTSDSAKVNSGKGLHNNGDVTSMNNTTCTAAPLLPPGGLKSKVVIPAGFVPAKRPVVRVQVAPGPASTSARVASVPRPGGGPIRRAGGKSAVPRPYYPSADPNRYGSKEQSSDRT
mmetsp:Transcript_8955/g.11563  ORF Transcript_8955/g.11563 Transcript_8955/m.11563 type:complete len:439 (-) Transcript_8955:28-1344(-)